MLPSSSPITVGKIIKTVDVGGLVLTEAWHPPEMEIPAHHHEYASMMCVIAGASQISFARQNQYCTSYDLTFMPPGETHASQYSRVGAQCLLVEIKPQRLDSIRQFSRVLDEAAYHSGGMLSGFMKKIYREFCFLDSASPLAIEGLMFELLAHSSREKQERTMPNPPRWLRLAKDYIHEHFAQPMSLNKVAANVGIHPAHLAKLFRQEYRCTVGEYIRELRLDQAAQELLSSDKSLVEIAASVGFYDQSHFTNAFRLKMGVSPAQFRKMSQRDKNAPKKRQ